MFWWVIVYWVKKDYWTNLRNQLEEGSAHYAQVEANGAIGKVAASAILEAIAKEKIAMKRATYGTRYVDILKSYGINVNYQMLQRPELVGLGRGSINVTDVVQTSAADSPPGDEDSLGNLAGHGISGSGMRIKRKTFPEHGTLLNLCIVRPKLMDPHLAGWFDHPRDYTSFYDPGLVPLPAVEVRSADVVGPTPTTDDQIGFQPSKFISSTEWKGNLG